VGTPERAGPGRAQRLWRKAAWVVVPILLGYLLPEALLTAVHGREETFVVVSEWFVEDAPALTFDPVLGYLGGADDPRLGALGNDGSVLSVGHLRRPDLGGVVPGEEEDAPPAGRRIAVFGGTTTAGAYLERNWSQGVEARLVDSDEALDLIDLSQHGVGLANWWSVATRALAGVDTRLDGLVIAVAEGELEQGFTLAGAGCAAAQRGGPALCVTSADTARVPFTRAAEAAQAIDTIHPLTPLTTHEIDRLLASPTLDAPRGPLRPFLASRVIRGLSRSGRGDLRAPCHRDALISAPPPCLPSPVHEAMVEDLVAWVDAEQLDVLVVRVPTMDETFFQCDVPPDLRCIADMLGAEIVDGVDAFHGTSRRQVRQGFLKGDGRWSQEGSDRFAAWISEILVDWPDQ
jgi:hypothetical protein